MYYLCFNCEHFSNENGLIKCKLGKFSLSYVKLVHPTILVRNCLEYQSTNPYAKDINRYDIQLKRAYYWLKRRAVELGGLP